MFHNKTLSTRIAFTHTPSCQFKPIDGVRNNSECHCHETHRKKNAIAQLVVYVKVLKQKKEDF